MNMIYEERVEAAHARMPIIEALQCMQIPK